MILHGVSYLFSCSFISSSLSFFCSIILYHLLCLYSLLLLLHNLVFVINRSIYLLAPMHSNFVFFPTLVVLLFSFLLGLSIIWFSLLMFSFLMSLLSVFSPLSLLLANLVSSSWMLSKLSLIYLFDISNSSKTCVELLYNFDTGSAVL